MKKDCNYLKLLWDFFCFGCFTFGGGLSIISQMRQLYVEKRKTLTAEEILDLTSVAKSLPGVMIANVAMLYGYRVGGVLGGLTCMAGMCTPPLVILLLISVGYNSFRQNYWVNAAMEGIQAAVPAIIGTACLGLVKGSIKGLTSILIVITAVVMYLVFEVSVVYLVLMGLACGLIIGQVRVWKEEKNRGSA